MVLVTRGVYYSIVCNAHDSRTRTNFGETVLDTDFVSQSLMRFKDTKWNSLLNGNSKVIHEEAGKFY